MAKAKIYSAIVKATGQQVQVYALRQTYNGNDWALYEDGGKTCYRNDQLQF